MKYFNNIESILKQLNKDSDKVIETWDYSNIGDIEITYKGQTTIIPLDLADTWEMITYCIENLTKFYKEDFIEGNNI